MPGYFPSQASHLRLINVDLVRVLVTIFGPCDLLLIGCSSHLVYTQGLLAPKLTVGFQEMMKELDDRLQEARRESFSKPGRYG